MKKIGIIALVAACLGLAGLAGAQEKENPMVKLVTSAGDITLEF